MNTLDDEIWVDALEFEGYYEVSNMGRIKSLGRWVPNGKSERWVKERILKQAKSKDGRMNCKFHINNIKYSINPPALIYFSFNRDKYYADNTYCVYHKNKITSDNRLINLALDTKSVSSTINYEKGLLPHLAENSRIKTEERLARVEKTCTICNKTKPVKEFDPHRFVCIPCRTEQRKQYYKNNKEEIKKRRKKK